MSETVTFNLDLTPEALAGLEKIRELTGKSSLAETVRSLLHLYMVLKEQKLPNSFEKFTNDEIETLQMIFQSVDDDALPDPDVTENAWFVETWAKLKKEHSEIFYDRFMQDQK